MPIFDYQTGQYLPDNADSLDSLFVSPTGPAVPVPPIDPASITDIGGDATQSPQPSQPQPVDIPSDVPDAGISGATPLAQTPTNETATPVPVTGVSTSNSGYSSDKFHQIQRDLGGQSIPNQYRGVEQYGLQTSADDAARAKATTAATQVANDNYAQKQADLATAQYGANQKLEVLQQQLATQADAARQQAVGLAKAARASYQQRVSALASMEINPAAGIQAMTTLNKGVSAMALFAQGMLATKGINIDVKGTLDNWVDRTIQAQHDQISRGEKLADADQTMWNMVRQESTDDADARSRVAGYLVGRAQAHLNTIASQFAGPIAQAQSAQANATLQAKLDETLGNVEGKTYGVLSDTVDKNAAWVISQAKLAHESESLGIERQKLALEAGKQTQYKDPGGIYDLTGQRIASFRPGATDEQKQKIDAQNNQALTVLRDIGYYKKLSQDSYYAGPGSALFSANAAKVKPVLARLQSEMAQLNQIGQNQTESEMARVFAELPQNSLLNLQDDKTNAILDDLTAAVNENVGYGMHNLMIMPTDIDREYDKYVQPYVGAMDPARDATSRLGSTTTGGVTPDIDVHALDRKNALAGTDGTETVNTPTKYWTAYTASGAADALENHDPNQQDKQISVKDAKPFPQAIAMEKLADRATAGNDDDKQTLVNMAADSSSPRRAAFAAWLLQNVVGVTATAGQPTIDIPEDEPQN